MARYIDADKLIEHINNMPWKMDSASEITKFLFLTTVEEAPTADVAPKSEVAREILSDLKKAVHDKAVCSYGVGIDAYISIKTFDAVLQNFINKYRGDR